MKKIIMLAWVIVTTCLTNLQAQKSGQVTSRVAEAFSNEFKTATDVHWTKVGNIFQSRFFDKQDYCLAYFNEEGKMILNGKRISFDIAPSAVKKATDKIRNASEKNHELLEVTGVYELSDENETSYFINLGSESLSMSLMAYGNGGTRILKKENLKTVEDARPALISKQK